MLHLKEIRSPGILSLLKIWYFIIVKDKEKIMEISKAQPFTKFLEDAPYVVIPLADEKKSNYWL